MILRSCASLLSPLFPLFFFSFSFYFCISLVFTCTKKISITLLLFPYLLSFFSSFISLFSLFFLLRTNFNWASSLRIGYGQQVSRRCCVFVVFSLLLSPSDFSLLLSFFGWQPTGRQCRMSQAVCFNFAVSCLMINLRPLLAWSL